MGHTNSTANLALPQFVGSDKPTWLGDINGAFSDIDAYVGTNDAAVAAAASDASSAIGQASAAVSTANNANTTAGNASTVANNAIGVANNAVAIAGAVDAKVGLLADLNTTDRTSIVNAINEIDGLLPGNAGSVSVTADGVKTAMQLLNALNALIDYTKIRESSYLVIDEGTGKNILPVSRIVPNNYAEFGSVQGTTAKIVNVFSSSSVYGSYAFGTSTYTDNSSTVITTGHKFIIVY